MSNLEVTLWCWVIGDKPPSRRVFPVHISHESTIGVLKVEIKKQKQKAFDLIDADALDLYKISLAENDMDTELPIINVDSLNILRPKQQLSAVYSDPVMDLVVIKPPGSEYKRFLPAFVGSVDISTPQCLELTQTTMSRLHPI
jgi:Crinkler effector protein N-terminal domain